MATMADRLALSAIPFGRCWRQIGTSLVQELLNVARNCSGSMHFNQNQVRPVLTLEAHSGAPVSNTNRHFRLQSFSFSGQRGSVHAGKEVVGNHQVHVTTTEDSATPRRSRTRSGRRIRRRKESDCAPSRLADHHRHTKQQWVLRYGTHFSISAAPPFAIANQLSSTANWSPAGPGFSTWGHPAIKAVCRLSSTLSKLQKGRGPLGQAALRLRIDLCRLPNDE